MTEQAEKRSFKPLGVVLGVVGLGFLGAGFAGIERGVTFVLGNFIMFAGIATFIYQTYVQD